MEILLTQKWNDFLDKFDVQHKDLYYCEEYVKLYETEEGKAF